MSFGNASLYRTALFKAEAISFADRTARMLIGFVLTLATQKLQANASVGGKLGLQEKGGWSSRQNMTRTSAPFVPRDPEKRITALENV